MSNSNTISIEPQKCTPHVSWWEQLVFERVIKEFIQCPTPKCKTYNDSADVVCHKDSTVLAGSHINNPGKTILINIIRFAALAVALAVGYLHWMWPTYVFGGIVAIVFFSLFLRNHSITLRYFLVIAIIILIGEFVWKAENPEGRFSTEVTWIIVFALLVIEVFFLVAYSLRASDDVRKEWLKNHGVDIGLLLLTWISFLLTTSMLLVAAFISSWIVPYLLPPVTIGVLMLQLARLAFSAALFTSLVSSTIYSLQGAPFVVPDRWKHRRILEPWKPRFRLYEARPSSSWHKRLTEKIKKITIYSANSMLRSLANMYNYFIVGFIDNLAHSVVKIANLLRCIAIKTALHLGRSIHRFIKVSKWSVQWASHIALRYSEVFLIPPISIICCSVLLYGVSEDFFGYVHQGPAFLPVYLTLKVLGATVLFTLASNLLLHLGFFTFFEKILNALSVFGTSAFLFFWLTACGLGIFGMITNGPYRIGWVTILSTVLVLSVFVFGQRHATEPEEDSRGRKQAL